MKKKLSFLLFLLFFLSYSQTKVKGIVYDELDRPVDSVKISFKGTSISTLSSQKGKFFLSSEQEHSTLVIDYEKKHLVREITLDRRVNRNIEIRLNSEKSLQEITLIGKPKKKLSKKENPAYKILQGIWKNKERNDIRSLESYDYRRYTSVNMGLNNMDSILATKILGNDYTKLRKILMKEDQTEGKIAIPVFMNELSERIYGKKNKERIDIEGERKTGLNEVGRGFGVERFSQVFDEINPYEDDIRILDKSFVSPLSTRGYGVYQYALKDSISEGGHMVYTIHFFPINSGDLLFQGRFKVVDGIFAITDIWMKTTRQINMSLVRDFSIEKHYTEVKDDFYLPGKSQYDGNFTLFSKRKDEMGVYVKKEINNSDYQLDQFHDESFYQQKIVQTRSDQFEKNDDYWKTSSGASEDTEETLKIIQGLKSNKKINRITDIITIASTGYIDLFKGLQTGSLWKTVSSNNVEGLRLRMGFRTYKTEDDKLRFNFYGAYGIDDRKFKYGIEGVYLLSSQQRIVVGASHLRDNLQLSSRLISPSDLLPKSSNANSLIRRGENYYLSNVTRNTINFDWALHNNLHINVSGVHQQIESADPNLFSMNYTLPNSSEIQNKLTDFATNISIMYTPGRNVYGYGVEQKFGKLPYPTFLLKYTKGYKGVFNSDFNYNKLQLLIKENFFLSNFGVLNASVELGKTFNTVPLPLLSPITADQSLSVVPNSFALLNYYNFTTDAYIMGHFEHHFNGFILNRIPLIKKLKWRSLIFYRLAYGSISQNNIDINKSSVNYVAPNNAVYSEYGFGIENIGYGNIRPFRVDFVWRSTMGEFSGIVPPTFGVRFGFKPGF